MECSIEYDGYGGYITYHTQHHQHAAAEAPIPHYLRLL